MLLGNVNKNYGEMPLHVLCHGCNGDTSNCWYLVEKLGALHIPGGFCKMVRALWKTVHQLNTKLPLDQADLFHSILAKRKEIICPQGPVPGYLVTSARGVPNSEELKCLLCAFWPVCGICVCVFRSGVRHSVLIPSHKLSHWAWSQAISQKGPAIFLFLPATALGLRGSLQLCRAFIRGVEIWTRVLMCTQHVLLTTEPSRESPRIFEQWGR